MVYDPKCEDTKKAIKDAVSEAVAEVKENTEGLIKKNSELLGKLKKAQKGAEIDPADHAALESDLEEARGKLRTAEKLAKTATAEAEKSKKSFEGESKVVHDLLVDQGLSAALLENGVKKPQFLNAAKALLANKVTLEADGEKRVAKVGDKTLSEHIKEWAGSDDGKEFVDAASNSGGGGGGGKGGDGKSKSMTRTAFEELGHKERSDFSKEGGVLTD